MKEVVQTEHFDPLLPLYGVWWSWFWQAWPRPEHLTLTQTNGVNVLVQDLQDQTSIHDIQQGICVEPLLLVLDLRGSREPDLLQTDGTKQVHLVWGGLQVSIIQPAALGVTDRFGSHRCASVLELQVQVCYCSRGRQDMGQTCYHGDDEGSAPEMETGSIQQKHREDAPEPDSCSVLWNQSHILNQTRSRTLEQGDWNFFVYLWLYSDWTHLVLLN